MSIQGHCVGPQSTFLFPKKRNSFPSFPQGSKLGLRDTVIIGGMEMTSQAVALSKRPHVVIATPGRLQDHFDSSSEMAARFSQLRFLVLDEADRLLDVGFEKEMGAILKNLPQKRQTLLFSATMTENLRQLQVRRLCNSPF
jgi:ATP-dependent RNA helicase DDX49/DBP8